MPYSVLVCQLLVLKGPPLSIKWRARSLLVATLRRYTCIRTGHTVNERYREAYNFRGFVTYVESHKKQLSPSVSDVIMVVQTTDMVLLNCRSHKLCNRDFGRQCGKIELTLTTFPDRRKDSLGESNSIMNPHIHKCTDLHVKIDFVEVAVKWYIP